MFIHTLESLEEFEDYINKLNETVGLSTETYQDIMKAVSKERTKLKSNIISDVSYSFEDELNKLKEHWERRVINENDIKILENEVKYLSEKYRKNLSLSHNYGVNKDNRIYVCINLI